MCVGDALIAECDNDELYTHYWAPRGHRRRLHLMEALGPEASLQGETLLLVCMVYCVLPHKLW